MEEKKKMSGHSLERLRGFLSDFRMNKRGDVSVKDAVLLAVAFFVSAIVMPIGITEIANANTTGWNTAVTTVFTILFPILALIALVLRFVPTKVG